MLKVLKIIGGGYLIIGQIFGVIAGTSYVWGPVVTWMLGSISFSQLLGLMFAWFGLFIIAMALLAYISKMLLWLPSLIIWFTSNPYNYSLGKWVAPGLYMAAN
jgi:hypothetical protein